MFGVTMVVAPLGVQAQAASARDTVRAELGSARSDLRNLVIAQEVYYSRRGHYATVLDSLEYAPSNGSRVTLTMALRDGWTATLTRARLRGNCVIFVHVPVGVQPKTALDGAVPEEGAPLCDSQPELSSATVVPTPASTSGDSVRQRINTARADLRNLVTAQEAYFADHARYALRLEELEHTRYRASDGTVLRLVNAGTLGWGAELTHPQLQGSCTIWVNLGEDKRPATRGGTVGREGEPVCDGMPARR